MDLMWLMMAPSATAPYIASASLMWVVMMIAMMVPAAIPLAAMYRGVLRHKPKELLTFLFACGYLLSWSVFSVIAALLQWWLHANGWLFGMSLKTSQPVAAVIWASAGIWQLTPMKDACLSRCQSPLSFLLANWRDGRRGAVILGAQHGLYCVGCCWVLMALMFAGGAMSVIVMAALAIFIVAERLIPSAFWGARVPGAMMIGVAIYIGFR